MPYSVQSIADQHLVSYATGAAESNGIPTDYFYAFLNAESGWNPSAVSNKGALGIAQIIPSYHPGVDPLDPYSAIDYSAKTIRGYYDQFGSWEDAFAAWNAGPGAVKKYGGVPPYEETQNFVKKITGGGLLPTPSPTPTLNPLPSPNPEDSLDTHGVTRTVLFAIGIVLLIYGFRRFYGR